MSLRCGGKLSMILLIFLNRSLVFLIVLIFISLTIFWVQVYHFITSWKFVLVKWLWLVSTFFSLAFSITFLKTVYPLFLSVSYYMFSGFVFLTIILISPHNSSDILSTRFRSLKLFLASYSSEMYSRLYLISLILFTVSLFHSDTFLWLIDDGLIHNQPLAMFASQQRTFPFAAT